MASPSPLRQQHIDAGATLLPYGPPDTEIELAETFDALELEYAALRKRCVLIDRPDRGLIEVTGAERVEFLNNMLTQELKDIEPGQTRASFWLNRKGRVDTELRLLHLQDRTLFDLDVHTASATVDALGGFIFAEDATLADVSGGWHRLELIGPTAAELLTLAVQGEVPGPDRVGAAEIKGVPVILDHDVSLGVPAFGLTLAADRVPLVEETLLGLGSPQDLDRLGEVDGHVDDDGTPASRIRLRRAGWHALNIARIEAGQPRFMLDFGPNNLPGETGILRERVSFTKGCYLGQEVVARMDALGHPKQILVAIRCEKQTLSADRVDPVHPVTGSHVFARGDMSKPVGAVTSATLSPSLGNVPVCFAQVKWGHHEAGTELTIQAEGLELDAVVNDGLRFVR